MTLSERIMAAWLEANPEPDEQWTPRFDAWQTQFNKFQAQLTYEAYESAVIQFLMPEDWGYQISEASDKAIASGLLKMDTPHSGRVWDSNGSDITKAGATAAEALLTAILAARERC